jgi:hypothetical protein
MTTDHLLACLADAEQLDNRTRSASAVAKLRYLCRIPGIRSTAKQFLKFETIPGLDKKTLNGLVMSTVHGSDMSEQRKAFYGQRVNVVQAAERTLHVRGRNHWVCAKEFDILQASPPDTFAGWKARQFEEVRLTEKSLAVPRSVEPRELSR